MPSWNQLIDQLEKLSPNEKIKFIANEIKSALNNIGEKRNNTNVIFYASSFLQKQDIPFSFSAITKEDLNGFMSTIHGMDWNKGLTLILHTPGGDGNAAESIIEYLISKFDYIEVIIPTYAMSAGTIMALAADQIIMSSHSQLGPIDSQLFINNSQVSAQSVVDQFEKAKAEIAENPDLITVWYPILQTIGPALLQEAQNALDYGSKIVINWLTKRMFKKDPNKEEKAQKVAEYFRNASIHKSHGHPINRNEIRDNTDLIISDLENDQDLQDYVLTAYHLLTIAFQQTTASKIIESNHDTRWIKHWNPGIIK